MEYLVFLESVSTLPCPLRKLPEAFGLTASKTWYQNYFTTEENLNTIGPIPDVSYYGVNEIGEEERREFLAWNESQKSEPIFDNRRVLETYYQDDVRVLRQACRVFRRELMQIENIDAFLMSITIASACNKVLRKGFLRPDTLGLIPTGGYTCNTNYSKKALMWLLHMEQIDGVKFVHGHKSRKYKVPELSLFILDVYCPETRKIYEFFGCHSHGHTCQPIHDVITMNGDTLAERYERTMSSLEHITRAGYLVKFQRECEFDDAGIVKQKTEQLAHPIVLQSALRSRDTLYGGRTEAICLHYKGRENETIKYFDVMSLYPYECMYMKFPVVHPIVHEGDECMDIEAWYEWAA